jgi:putative GTP pyrophosphokinase
MEAKRRTTARNAAAAKPRDCDIKAKVSGTVAMDDFDIAQQAFREYYDANISRWRDAEKSLQAQILGVLSDQPAFATPHVVSRIKSCEECISKFQRKYLAPLADAKARYAIQDHIVDLIGLRIICLYETDIVEIARLLEAEFDVLAISDKAREVEITADTFRYKGLHLDMALSERRRALPAYSQLASMRFEVQVRTAIQDAWSTLDHAIKYKKDVPHELSRRVNALAALFEIADREFLAIRNQISDFADDAPSTADAHSTDGLQKHFPRFQFDERRVRGFVEQLHSHSPTMTPTDLENAMTTAKASLLEYATHQWFGYRNTLNPLTLARHAAYLRDPAAYANLLSEAQRVRFDEWRESATRNGHRRVEPDSGVFDDGQEPDWFPE